MKTIYFVKNVNNDHPIFEQECSPCSISTGMNDGVDEFDEAGRLELHIRTSKC